MAKQTLYDRAEERVNSTPELSKRAEFILADWPEGDEHWRWVINTPVDDIVKWVEAGE